MRRLWLRLSAYHRRAAIDCWHTCEGYTHLASSRFILLQSLATPDAVRIADEVRRYTAGAATSGYQAHRHARLAVRYLRLAESKPRPADVKPTDWSTFDPYGFGVIGSPFGVPVSTIYDETGKKIGFTTAGDGRDIHLSRLDAYSITRDAMTGITIRDEHGHIIGEDFRMCLTPIVRDVHSTDPPMKESNG